MAVPVRVAVDAGDAQRALRMARNLGEDPRPLLDIAGSVLEESTRERFRTSTGPGGLPWPPSRRAASSGGRTLIDKGGLVSSITSETRPNEVEVGIIAKTESAKFAYVHHYGAVIRPRRGPFLIFTAPDGHKVFVRSVTIPARPIIGVDDQDRADLTEAWYDYIRSLLK